MVLASTALAPLWSKLIELRTAKLTQAMPEKKKTMLLTTKERVSQKLSKVPACSTSMLMSHRELAAPHSPVTATLTTPALKINFQPFHASLQTSRTGDLLCSPLLQLAAPHSPVTATLTAPAVMLGCSVLSKSQASSQKRRVCLCLLHTC